MLISARLLYNRSNRTLAVHLRVLGKLLSMKESSPNGPTKDPGSLSARLLCYVIATCYSKMVRQLKHKTLSQPYIRSLNQVNTVDVNNSFNVNNFKLDKSSPQRIQHDRLFLTKFFLTTLWSFETNFQHYSSKPRWSLIKTFNFTPKTHAQSFMNY